MSKFIGRVVDIGLAKESSRGVGAIPTFWIPHVALSFDDKVVKVREEAGVGELADSDNVLVTTKYGQGDLEGEVRDKSIGLLLYNLLGAVSTSGPTDSAYTHAFTLSESAQHQSLSLLAQDPISSELYKLVMIDSLEITSELDDLVRFTASFMGKKGNSWATQTPSYTSENKFTKKHVQVKIAANIAGLAAATAISLKRLKLTIAKNVILDDVLGTAEPEDILNRQISVEGELELNYEDETYKNYMKDNSTKSLQIAFINNDVTIGAATNPSLTIQMPKVDFFDWEPQYDNDEIVRQVVSFKAMHDVTNSQKIIHSCSLVNAQVSY